MDRWQYLIVLGACLLITAPLEFFGDGVYRQARRAAFAVLPVAAVFVVWDAMAIAADVWTYNPRYVTGIDAARRHPDRGTAVLHRDPGVRAADLQRRRHHADVSEEEVRRPIGAVRRDRSRLHAARRGRGRRGVRAGIGVLRTGLFRRAAYWISMVIVIGFQILVDGWLTKLSAPIVIYNEQHTSGIRFPFDIPSRTSCSAAHW